MRRWHASYRTISSPALYTLPVYAWTRRGARRLALRFTPPLAYFVDVRRPRRWR